MKTKKSIILKSFIFFLLFWAITFTPTTYAKYVLNRRITFPEVTVTDTSVATTASSSLVTSSVEAPETPLLATSVASVASDPISEDCESTESSDATDASSTTEALSNWEKVYTTDGPYADDLGTYYIRYMGQKDIADQATDPLNITVDLNTAMPNGTLLDIPITTTDRLFEQKESDSIVVSTIILPKSWDMSLEKNRLLLTDTFLSGHDQTPVVLYYYDSMGSAQLSVPNAQCILIPYAE